MLLPVQLALPSATVPDKKDPPSVEIPARVTRTTEHPNLHGGHALESPPAPDRRAFIPSANRDAGLRRISSSSPLRAGSPLDKGRVRKAADDS